MLKRVFSEGYRIFFLAAGLFAVLAVGWWELYLAVDTNGGVFARIPFDMAPQHWHGRELVFGYGGAALGGFLLTAVPNWTGAKGARHVFIALAASVWFAGRLASFWSGALPLWAAAIIELAFVPILWAKIAALLIHRPKPQNVLFLVFLTLFWIADFATWLGLAGLWVDGMATGSRAGIMALAGMILVIAGRVGPGFTRNAMHREGVPEAALPRDWPGFTSFMLAAAVLMPLTALALPGAALTAAIAIVTGVAQLLRQARWGIGFAATRPILAILHLAAALVGLGLILHGLARFTFLSEIAALHLLAVGGIGGMTLAMMSRATLGHSGRPLVAPRAVALAYLLIPISASLRWAASEAMGAFYVPGVLTAGALWVVAFGLYIGALFPAFVGPRLDR